MARYAALVEQPQALLASIQAPLPVTLWVNPLKTTPAALIQTLQTEHALTLDPIDWMPGAFRAGQWQSPGQTLAFTAGWYYVQEEIAMAAVQVLDPQPGDRILDLCAAPGGKTAQIAVRLHNRGAVVANELRADRLPSLGNTVARLGLTNVTTTHGDGRCLDCPSHHFDRVLVDAPCSGEGTVRRRPQQRLWNPTYSQRIATVKKNCWIGP